MKRKILCNIVCILCSVSVAVCAPKDSIYNGTQVKLDILSPVLAPALNKWTMQHYELAVNVRLAQRFYPTLELGYAGGQTNQGDSITYNGQGGFVRVGCDINPLKKHPDSPHALLVGVRVGTAVQGFEQNLKRNSLDFADVRGGRADCWGEIVAGCQVEIAKVKQTAFYMGWMGRFKFLFTRKEATDRLDEFRAPIYIPGYGTRDNIAWGANYYLGWRF